MGNGGQESACGWCKDKWGDVLADNADRFIKSSDRSRSCCCQARVRRHDANEKKTMSLRLKAVKHRLSVRHPFGRQQAAGVNHHHHRKLPLRQDRFSHRRRHPGTAHPLRLLILFKAGCCGPFTSPGSFSSSSQQPTTRSTAGRPNLWRITSARCAAAALTATARRLRRTAAGTR